MSNIMQTSLSYAYDYMLRMDDRRVGQPGAVVLPLELENDDVRCFFRAKCPKRFARAVGARFITLKSSLKRRKKLFVCVLQLVNNHEFVKDGTWHAFRSIL